LSETDRGQLSFSPANTKLVAPAATAEAKMAAVAATVKMAEAAATVKMAEAAAMAPAARTLSCFAYCQLSPELAFDTGAGRQLSPALAFRTL